MRSFDFQLRTRIVFGEGALGRLGELGRELGFARTLVTADAGLIQAGHVETALALLRDAGVEAFVFHDFRENPDSDMVERGRRFAARHAIDSFVGLGGGSSMDTAKGINFVLTNGGTMKDYWGYGEAKAPLLPMIGIPTTAGTGSEAQSYTLISDPATHAKMACGDPGAAFRAAILDPQLTVTQPRSVTAVAGYDALAHAVETAATTKRNAFSEVFSREAWRLLAAHYERVLENPNDLAARSAMLLGAHYAGVAIESSMLGATHACANPLTARYGTPHGVAIALMLPHVVRWNAEAARESYRELSRMAGLDGSRDPGGALAARLSAMARAGGLPETLREAGVREKHLAELAEQAGRQWTGKFNPRPFDAASALALYQHAF